MSASRSKNTYLAAKCRRIASRRGPMKAIVAVEHSMLIAIWHMLTDATSYQDHVADYYTRLKPERAKNRAVDQLRQLGYNVDLTPVGAAVA
jgi:type II secretory pathway component PulL